MTTGERIREARIKAGLTQHELAQKIGVKFSAIHKYESGIVVNLKRETISALADALDVKPSWLMCMDDDQAESRKLTDRQKRYLDILEKAPPETQDALIDQLEGLVQLLQSQNRS